MRGVPDGMALSVVSGQESAVLQVPRFSASLAGGSFRNYVAPPDCSWTPLEQSGRPLHRQPDGVAAAGERNSGMPVHALTLAEAAAVPQATSEGHPGWQIGSARGCKTPLRRRFRSPAAASPPTRTRAAAVLVPEQRPGGPAGVALLRSPGPHRSFLAVVRALRERRARPSAGVAGTARVHPAATAASSGRG